MTSALDLTTEDRDALGAARDLARAGVPVFVAPPNPAYGPDDRREYLLPTGWQHTKADPAALDAWRPGWAVCILTGYGLDGIDVDPKNGASVAEQRARLDALGVVVLAVVVTPSGGAHYYVRSTGLGNAARPAVGVDYRGRGGFLYAPGTARPRYDGAGYVWAEHVTPDDLDDLDPREDEGAAVRAYLDGLGDDDHDRQPAAPVVAAEPVPGLPEWLRDELADLGVRTMTTDDRGQPHTVIRWADKRGVLTLSRSERFYRLVAMCRRAHLTQGQTVTALTPWCAAVDKYVGREAAEVARVWADVEPEADRWVRTLPEGPTGRPALHVVGAEDTPGEDSPDVEDVEPEPWDDPVPLGAGTPEPVPLDGLPGYLRRIVEGIERQSQAPREVVLAAALGTLAAATRGAWDVHVRPGWNAGPTVLWLAALASSGERKGAGTAPLVAPLMDAERHLAAEVRRANRNREAERKRLEAALKAADAEGDPTGWQRLADALHESRPRPVPSLVQSDATTEALGAWMSVQGGAVAIFGTEATAFQTVAGRYSDAGGNFGLLNHAYDGERFADLRVKREGIRVERPALAWCVAVQPEVMGKYADAQSEGSGFLARFALLVPESKRGAIDWHAEPCAPEVVEEWAGVVERLHAAAWERYAAMVDDLPDDLGQPARIDLTPDAAALIVGYGQRLDVEHLEGGLAADLGGWTAKAPARIARLAAVLALAEDPTRRVVEVEHVAAALSLADALTTHAGAAFRIMRHAAERDPSTRLVALLRRKRVPVVTTRDIWQAVRDQSSWVTGAEDVRRALLTLVDLGYLRGPVVVTGPKGGRPSERWEVHPTLLG